MAFQLFRSKQNSINLYISNYSIQLLELKSTDPLIVNRFVECYLPDGTIVDGTIKDFEKLSMIVEQCISDWGIKRKKIRFITPDAFVMVRKVKIPLELNDDEIKGYLYLELGHNIHLPFEEPVFDFVPLEQTENEKEILLFAAPESIIKQYTDLFASIKLDPCAADLSALCSYRFLFEKGQVTAKENTLHLEIKLDSINFSIFENLKPIFTRHMQLEGMMKNWKYKLEPESKLYYQYELTDKDTLTSHFRDVIKEVEKIINFYRFSIHQGNKQITQIILVGDNPYIADFTEMLKDEVNSITILYDHNKVYTPKNLAVPSKFHTVLGLALKEV
jgi:type IV pilus assembly protein PilM